MHLRSIGRAASQAASRRFRWTSSSEIAAGVTPLMRAAWPMVAGRLRLSFSSTSAERPRNGGVLVAPLALDFLALALEVAGIFGLHLNLGGHVLALHRRTEFGHRCQLDVIEFGATQQVQRVGFAAHRDAELAFDGCAKRVVGRGP
jgi:hypothetical protein